MGRAFCPFFPFVQANW